MCMQEWVSTVVGRLSQEKATQSSIAQLLGVAFTNLFADPVFLKTSAKFAVDVISQEQVVVEAKKP